MKGYLPLFVSKGKTFLHNLLELKYNIPCYCLPSRLNIYLVQNRDIKTAMKTKCLINTYSNVHYQQYTQYTSRTDYLYYLTDSKLRYMYM